MHSGEVIQMLLSHAPLRYSIKELSDLTGFHRNTIRPAVKELTEKDELSNFGNSQYYSNTISEHYRILGRSLYDLDLGFDDNTKLNVLRQFGRNLVVKNLNRVINEEYTDHFNHTTIGEALLHLKLSYPFADVTSTISNENTSDMKIDVTFEVETNHYETDKEMDLHIYPCLCRGDTSQSFLCEMVAGALEGGIISACQAEPLEVLHLGNAEDELGKYCRFYIRVAEGFNDPDIKAAEEYNLI